MAIQYVLQEVTTLREETAFTPLSLEAKIDQFHLEEEGEVPERPVELSDFEANFNRFSVANLPRLVVAQIDFSSEEEEMTLNQRKSLRDLMSTRNKGATSQETPSPKFLQLFPLLSLLTSDCMRWEI